MKRKVFLLSLFLVTFLIGSFAAWLMLREPETIDCEIPKINSVKVENVAPTMPLETMSKPKIFKVQHIEGAENQENNNFIEPGEVTNPEDFKFKRGETWMGLFGKNEDYTLRQTKVHLRKFREHDLDWTNISVKDKEKPLFLVKNLKRVKAGKIVTLFRGTLSDEADENNQSTAIEKGFYKEFKLGERNYTLRVEQGLSENRETIAVLILETGTESQIIDVVYTEGDWVNMGSLYWVGDLDKDGKLDLYKDFWNYEKGYYLSGLFLSSEAKKGQLVRRFEFLAYGGC